MSYSKRYNFTNDNAEGVYIPIPSGGNLTLEVDDMNETHLRGHFYWEFYDKDSDGNFNVANPTGGTINFQWRPYPNTSWNDTEAGEQDVASADQTPRADTSYTEARMVLENIVGAEYVWAYVYRWDNE